MQTGVWSATRQGTRLQRTWEKLLASISLSFGILVKELHKGICCFSSLVNWYDFAAKNVKRRQISVRAWPSSIKAGRSQRARGKLPSVTMCVAGQIREQCLRVPRLNVEQSLFSKFFIPALSVCLSGRKSDRKCLKIYCEKIGARNEDPRKRLRTSRSYGSFLCCPWKKQLMHTDIL